MLITVGQLLTGPAGQRCSDAAVLVRNGLIAAAGPRAEVAAMAPPSAPRRDYPGSTLLPGLINGHVHLALDASADQGARLRIGDPAAMADRATKLLRCGVTTVRDLGDRDGGAVRVRTAIASGELTGPRILASVAPLTSPGGHCWFFGGEVRGEREMRAMVRRNAEAGSDVIKVMASGGHITDGGPEMWQSQFSAGELRAIVDEARRVGLPVAAHAHGTGSIAAAVAAGVSTVEHCTWMVSEDGRDMRADVAREMAERGIAACCTTGSRDWPEMIEKVGEAAARKVYGRYVWLEQRGVPLIMGTDAGVRGAPFDDIVGTLELYEWLGFPTERIIEIATAASADALGISGLTGRVAPGLSADLLVVDGDPYASLSALRAVQLVVAAGRPHFVADAAPRA